jgi:hypothetical protein
MPNLTLGQLAQLLRNANSEAERDLADNRHPQACLEELMREVQAAAEILEAS